MRVAVIGAGFSGLMAASELAVKGHDVSVFEARDRVGGRVWSERLGGTVIERGAEFVLDGYGLLRETAAALGLSLVDTTMSYYARQPLGVDVSIEELAAAAPLLARLAGESPELSVDELLDLSGLALPVRQAVAARASISAAWPSTRLAAGALCETASRIDDAPSHRIGEGNQMLAARLQQLIRRNGGNVFLSEPVTAVSYSLSGTSRATLRTDKSEFESDAVVVSVPLALLRELHFEPPLPARKLAALSRTAEGEAAKLHVKLEASTAPVAPSAQLSVPDLFWCWTATDISGLVAPVVNCFAGSTEALKRLDVDSGPACWVERLGSLRPDLDLDRRSAILTNWSEDKWAKMAYTAQAAGRALEASLIGEPVGPLHFAGEHTDVKYCGLMEGALRSGQRAAAEISLAEL